MNKFEVEVEYSDDGAAMAGANCGSIQRAEIMIIECENKDQVEEKIKSIFSNKDRYFQTLKRIRKIKTGE